MKNTLKGKSGHTRFRKNSHRNDNMKEKLALSIVKRLTDNGFQAYFAGGYVRDMLLGLEHDEDIDIATDAKPSTVANLFPNTVGVGEHFGVMLVIKRNIPFEVATFRTDGESEDGRHPKSVTFADAGADALRRDFTINGLFYDPMKKKVLDFVNGKKDLKAGVIRSIGDAQLRFREDYLRLLRGIRFAAHFSFTIELDTWKAITDNAEKINRVSRERVFQELSKMLIGPHPDTAVSLLDKSGLLAVILPEVSDLKGIEQPVDFHPEGDVFTHTLKTLSFLQNPTPVLAWSALLHDIGKPATFSHTDRIRFNNHGRVSARMAKNILRRMKSSRALMNDVYACIDNHMNFINVTEMRLSTLKKFLSRKTLGDELELHRADCLASHGNTDNYTFLVSKKKEMDEAALKPKPYLTGKDLITLGFTPGPIFGVILDKVYDLQLDEKITTPEEARTWVKKHKKELLSH